MNRSRALRAAIVPFVIMLSGCSDSPQAAKQAVPSEPVSAQSAFYKMFVSARTWAPDALPLRVAQIDVDEVKAANGRAGAWEAVFVSPGQAKYRRYVFSVIHRPARNLRSGVNAEPPEAWVRGGSDPFPLQGFKIDSTAAYETAAKHSAEYTRNHPDVPVKFILERTSRFPDPTWRVFWGESVSTSAYSVFVDAVTGDYLGTAR